MVNTTAYYPQFFTATILEWKKLLEPNKYKAIIIECLRFLVENKKVVINGFVIMDNHLHIIWQMYGSNEREKVQGSLLRNTAQKIKADLIENHPAVLEHLKVNAKDRTYQIWERNSLSIDLFTPSVFQQKLAYIHNNPVKAGLCKFPEEYYYSSAAFYETGKNEFVFLTHYSE